MMKFLLTLYILKIFEDFATSDCNVECQQECLKLHNIYRKNHQVEPLQLDERLMKQANDWANNNHTRSSSKWVHEGGGECWAWGSLYNSWTKVIKDWHDQEADFDWKNKKAKNDKSIYCFSQIVWKRARKLGCGRGTLFSAPFFVAQIDVSAVIVDKLIGYEADNIKEPLTNDLNWFGNVTATETRGKAKETV